MSEKVLLMPVGLPGSGKSTWARKTGIPMVNPDSIRLALHGHVFYQPAEPMVWATAHLMVSAMFKAGHDRVILDATNLTERRRQEWASKDWVRAYVEFRVPEDVCVGRMVAERKQPDMVPIIRRMAKDITWPSDFTGFEKTVDGLDTHATARFLHYLGIEQPAEISDVVVTGRSGIPPYEY